MKNKKYGLIVFDKSQNLGDDIQSYAATRYLPYIDYYIEREKLNEFVSDDGEVVNVIMNGWYMHDICSMPPSPFINPIFISTHFTDHLYNKCPEYLSGYFIEYLKKYQPIGCRDELVKKYLTENNIDNYWSGCLTLTIKKFENIKKEDYICAVDLDDEELLHLKSITNKEIRVITHKMDDLENIKLSYEERMKNVEKVLKIYQGASLVITTRLHCALPSLALETPVLMIFNSDNIDVKNRIGNFLEFLNYTSKNDFISGKNDDDIKNPKNNDKKYLEIQKKLIKVATDFVKEKTIDYQENKFGIELYKKYFIQQKKYLVDVLKQEYHDKIEIDKQLLINEYENRIILMKEEYENKTITLERKFKKQEYEMNRQINKYKLREEVLTKELEAAIDNYSKNYSNKVNELNNIKMSKGYRYLEKFRKIKRRLLRKDK